MLLLRQNNVAMASKLGHINVTMKSKQGHFTTFKVAQLHENDVQLRHFNRPKMIVIPTLSYNVKVTLPSNVVLTSKPLSIATWEPWYVVILYQ